MSRIVLSPNILPKEIVDVAKSMAPANFDMVVADFPTPAFMEAVKDAEYFVGFVRGGFDDAFYKNAPRSWGPDPLFDQQIAGMTMAFEQAAVFFAVFAMYLSRFLREERADPQVFDELRVTPR